ncbi:MAG: phosphopyruvate hydratase [Patescibacteria group bacterium]|jgi:enolase
MVKIKNISAREILDARGLPTIEARVFLDDDSTAVASVPSGSSFGNNEAWDLRDGDARRYQGQGVLKAVRKIQEIIAPALQKKKITEQTAIDQILIDLDGTENKKNLGVNAVLAVSLAVARAAAGSEKQELFVYLKNTFSLAAPKIPVPLFNIFNGGKHADTNLDFQEFLLIPKLASAGEMVRMGAEVFKELGVVLRESGYDTDTGVEGGYAPNLDSSIEALELILAAALRVGYKPGKDLHLGIDVGSSILYEEKKQKYIFPLDQAYFTSSNLIGLYNEWFKKYPLVYLEDGLAPEDWSAWRELTAELGAKMLIVGDDLFTTSSARLSRGLKEKTANAVVVKPNQAGTLTETIAFLKLAQKNKYKIIVSQRSCETNDDFIVDLAVASGADYLKAGSLSRGERVSKYNRLMAIADIIK